MAILNPLNETELIQQIRAKGIREAELSNEELALVIKDAIMEYNYYRPLHKITTSSNCIITEANVSLYDTPDDCLWVVNVFWAPFLEYSVYNNIVDSILGSSVNDVAILVIQYDTLSNLRKFFDGTWREIDGKIMLIPTPSVSGEKVPIIYATSKTLEELDAVRDRLFVELCYYRAMHQVGQKRMANSGWRAGAYQVDASVGREYIRTAEEALKDIRNRLANSYTGRA